VNAPIDIESLLGRGLYSLRDAARFIGAPPAQVRRWMRGYQSQDKHKVKRPQRPVIDSEFAGSEIEAISFRDLLELRFVQAFRKHNVSLQTIRKTADAAREMFQSSHPFTCRRFLTDGKGIFASVIEDSGEESLVDPLRHQNVFAKIIGPSLYAGIEFEGRNGRALRWFPTRSQAVVLDPQVRFGVPVVTNTGIPTVAIADAVRVEQSEARVARLFEVSLAAVRAAVRFEHQLARA
jgi:uncharacterized protein (DUF433 family)